MVPAPQKYPDRSRHACVYHLASQSICKPAYATTLPLQFGVDYEGAGHSSSPKQYLIAVFVTEAIHGWTVLLGQHNNAFYIQREPFSSTGLRNWVMACLA
jgi:hypothetical protein